MKFKIRLAYSKYSTIIVIAVLTACAPKIEYEWKSPDYVPMTYQKIAVFAFSDIYETRFRTEQTIVDVLKLSGYDAAKSLDYIGWQSDIDGDSKKVIAILLKEGVDGIITTTIRSQNSETIDVDGYSIPAYGGRFSHYYHRLSQTMRVPEDMIKDNLYLVEINFYQLDNDIGRYNFRWTGQSKVRKPSSLKKFTKKYAMVIYDHLIAQSILN